MNTIKIKPYTPTDIKVERISPTHIKVTVYPFESGYAITMAHPIRRLLLSSSIGYAPVALKIEGVSHEFDSIRGIVEDVSPFMVNLKSVRYNIKNKSDDKEVVLNYTFKGPMTLKGSDLANDLVDVVNKDLYLATLNDGAVLNFSLIVRKGIGYVPSEVIRNIIPVGYMPLDSFFTPVKKATYEIDNVLVEDNPSYEKAVFDIETDGQIDPLDAFKNAVAVMNDQLSIFSADLNVAHHSSGVLGDDSGEMKTLLMCVESLDSLPSRCSNALSAEGIIYVGEIALMSEAQIRKIKNMGDKSYKDLADKFAELGYPLGSELRPDLKKALVRKIDELKKEKK